MNIGRIIGHCVATRKIENFEGATLCLVQPLDEHFQPAGPFLVANDSLARRGVGDIVFYVESGDATATGPGDAKIPSDAAIVGLVDTMTLDLELYMKWMAN